ncbi:TetR/AcrR family transcriptional regulator [Streptomyces sp. NPDC091272]|uniref:TetR/AcrR family transcriptional regulator n=1 Tax=Streptomyces sp. NPDC091272 TaxID=3365981 RepID=UPI00380CBDC4
MPASADPRPYHHGNLRTELLAAAERGLRAHGADQLSLRDLAREIGVSHAAPRRHFADRRALLDALAEAGFVRLGADLRAALSEDDGVRAEDDGRRDFPARVRDAVTAYARFATENAALCELMNSSKHHPGSPLVTQAAAGAFQQMTDLIEEGQALGALDGSDPEEVGIILYATVQGITAMVNNAMIDAGRLDGLISTAVRQFLRGARP